MFPLSRFVIAAMKIGRGRMAGICTERRFASKAHSPAVGWTGTLAGITIGKELIGLSLLTNFRNGKQQ
jgi:hypothetical protein